ncbi:MAG: aminotransferase class I/II-fold pyridoxal phosphate-dependent enzyme [Rhodospirillaceae bacterium]
MHNSRLDALTEYPFQRLAALLEGLKPGGTGSPINMSIGEPQHAAPDIIYAELAEHASGWNKYPPTRGTYAYRSAVANWLTTRYCLEPGWIDCDLNTFPVAGTREALFMAAMLAVPPKKNLRAPAVLMPNPFYQVYLGAAVMAGAEPVFVPATKENGFQPDFSALDTATLDQTALAYLCSPANPQGTVADLERLQRTVALARKHDFVIVSDECYSEIYTGSPPPGLLQACAASGGSLSNVLVFNSLSKRSNTPGLRAGFVSGDKELIAKFQTLRSHGGAVQPLPVMAAATALWNDESHVDSNRSLYRKKFKDAADIFGSRFGFYVPDGGFFLWLDVGDGREAARALWKDGGIQVLPGTFLARQGRDGWNPGDRYIRVALVHDRVTTANALSCIFDILSKEV